MGAVRATNQDAVLPEGEEHGETGLVAVADGVGGHPGGDIASRRAVEGIEGARGGASVEELFDAARQRIREAIIEALDDRPEMLGMATTLTLARLCDGGVIEIGHTGDSRAYLLTDADLVQITEDHTHGMDLVVAGELTIEEARVRPEWHVLSNFLGFESFRVATHRVPLTPGDRLLLCTDGLTNMLTDA